MVTVVCETGQVTVPGWVTDLASFRRWADSGDVPEKAQICYLQGEVWVDVSWEQIFSHVSLKGEFGAVLGSLVKVVACGLFLGSGAMLSNVKADIACKPDGLFASNAALQHRVRLIEGKDGGYVEVEGYPDMVLEVVSKSSAHKDTELLYQLYWKAGVREYWLVDARKEPLTFDIFRHTAKGYRATPKKDGWLKSAMFAKSFRLTQQNNALGHPEYTLAVR